MSTSSKLFAALRIQVRQTVLDVRPHVELVLDSWKELSIVGNRQWVQGNRLEDARQRGRGGREVHWSDGGRKTVGARKVRTDSEPRGLVVVELKEPSRLAGVHIGKGADVRSVLEVGGKTRQVGKRVTQSSLGMGERERGHQRIGDDVLQGEDPLGAADRERFTRSSPEFVHEMRLAQS